MFIKQAEEWGKQRISKDLKISALIDLRGRTNQILPICKNIILKSSNIRESKCEISFHFELEYK